MTLARTPNAPFKSDRSILLIGDALLPWLPSLSRIAETNVVTAAQLRRGSTGFNPAVVIVDGDAADVADAAQRYPIAIHLLLRDDAGTAWRHDGHGNAAPQYDAVTVLPRAIDGPTLQAFCALALECAELRRALPEESGRGATGIANFPEGATLRELERQIFVQTLARTGGNQRRAAHLLGLRESTFRFRLRKLAIRSRRARNAAAPRSGVG